MGGGGSYQKIATEELQEIAMLDDDFQDHQHPWFHIVQWSVQNLPTDVVYKWNHRTVRDEVEALTEDSETFLNGCPPTEIESFATNFDSYFCDWSIILLKQIPSLSAVRYELVPKKMTELNFWMRYYAAVREIVKQQVLDGVRQQPPNNNKALSSK